MGKMNERQQKCPWCHPDETGSYTSARFTNPETKSSIMIFYSGAQETLALEKDGKPVGMMGHPIYYCPMCGRQLQKHPEETEEKA